MNPSATPAILNLTPHPVTVRRADGRGTVTFQPDGTVASLRVTDVPAGEWCGVVIVSRPSPKVIGLPAQIPGRLLIVSTSVFNVSRASRPDLVTPQWFAVDHVHGPPCEFLIGA